MLTTWEAVSTLDRVLDDVMGSAIGTATNSRSFSPAIDIHSDEKEVVFTCDVPGVKSDDLEVTLENHVLTLKGMRRFERKENERIMLGRTYGAFARAFTLPDAVDESNLSAHLENGVLTIRLPKHPKAQPRKIPILSNGSGSEPKQLGE